MHYTIRDFIINCRSWHRSYIPQFKASMEDAAAQLIARGEFTAEYLDGLSDGIREGLKAI